MVYVWDFDILNLLVIFLNSRFSFNFIRIKKIWFEIGMVNLSGLFIFCIIFKIDLKVFLVFMKLRLNLLFGDIVNRFGILEFYVCIIFN